MVIPWNFAALANLLRLIGHMRVGKERTHQVEISNPFFYKICAADAQSAINDLNGELLFVNFLSLLQGMFSGKVIFLVFVEMWYYWQVTQLDLHRHFHTLGAGVIEEVRVQRDKGFGFVRYSNHSEAALAIQVGNGRMLCGKPIKSFVCQCSWGSKPTPPGTASTPLPPPAAAFPGLSAADFFGYDRSLALAGAGANQALIHVQGQHALKQAAMGMGAGASQVIYDGGFQNVSAAQQLMYY
ncbi:hypothetical protein GW17_00056120 [Ensete ventricosum]|nr:hypothetical protein GW17_00056120 [Ensete ventricosum]